MAQGDSVLIYHSGQGKELVGLARVASAPYQDPKHPDSDLAVVDIEAVRRLPKRVTLAAIKSDTRFAGLALVRMPRLSVIPVPPDQWKMLLAMGGLSS